MRAPRMLRKDLEVSLGSVLPKIINSHVEFLYI